MSTIVTYQQTDLVATITMNDGKVNAMSVTMISEVNNALNQALVDKSAVVLTGRTGLFSAGFDLPVLKTGGAEAREMLRTGFELAERLLSFPKPVVIACSGHALAMGVFLVLSGDYRIGAEGDFKIGANEVAIGLTMPDFGIEICRQRLAPAHFNRAVINAEIYTPDQAVIAGFLDQVVPMAELLDVAQQKARQLTKLNMPAHAATKLRARGETLKALRQAIKMGDDIPWAQGE
jgi:enoyl-CoA hydratase